MNEENLEVVMSIIMHSGDAKSSAFEGIQAAKKGELKEAQEKIEYAEQALVQAHKVQTEMLTKEASGDKVELSLLMVHAQDHLMTSIMFVDIAKELIELHGK